MEDGNMARVDGYVKGTSYNESSRTFEFLKLGERDNGAIIGGFNVSGKDKDGNRVYGQPVKFKVNIKSASEGKRIWELLNANVLVEADGFFVPDNWTNKDGKEIKGNLFLVNKSELMVEKKNNATKQPAQDNSSWDSDDEVPF